MTTTTIAAILACMTTLLLLLLRTTFCSWVIRPRLFSAAHSITTLMESLSLSLCPFPGNRRNSDDTMCLEIHRALARRCYRHSMIYETNVNIAHHLLLVFLPPAIPASRRCQPPVHTYLFLYEIYCSYHLIAGRDKGANTTKIYCGAHADGARDSYGTAAPCRIQLFHQYAWIQRKQY